MWKTKFFEGLCELKGDKRQQELIRENRPWLVILDGFTDSHKTPSLTKVKNVLCGNCEYLLPPCVLLTSDRDLFTKIEKEQDIKEKCIFLDLGSVPIRPLIDPMAPNNVL
jgi:hypothetical protein